MNALVVLEFAFMFQEFLLGFSRFTTARNVYSLLYLLLTGFQSVQAYNFKATFTTSPQAPALDVALSYALLVVNTSDNLAAVSGVFAALGMNTAASIWLYTQAIVNYAITFIVAIGCYQKHGLSGRRDARKHARVFGFEHNSSQSHSQRRQPAAHRSFSVSSVVSLCVCSLFPDESDLKQPTILESSAAAGVMCGLVFLLVVDSYFVPFTRSRVNKKTR